MSAKPESARDGLPTDPATDIYVGRSRTGKSRYHLFEDCQSFSEDSEPKETTLAHKPLRSTCCGYCRARYLSGGEDA